MKRLFLALLVSLALAVWFWPNERRSSRTAERISDERPVSPPAILKPSVLTVTDQMTAEELLIEVGNLEPTDEPGLERLLLLAEKIFNGRESALRDFVRRHASKFNWGASAESHFVIAFAMMSPVNPVAVLEDILDLKALATPPSGEHSPGAAENLATHQAYAMDRLALRLVRGTLDPRLLANLIPRFLEIADKTPDRNLLRQTVIVLSLIDDSPSKFLVKKAVENRPEGDHFAFEDLVAW